MPIFIDNTGIYGDTAKTQPAPFPLGAVITGATISGASTIQIADGSAATPSLVLSNSTTTGLFRKAANSLGFAAAGVEVGSYGSAGVWTFGPAGSSAINVQVNGGIQFVPQTTAPAGVAGGLYYDSLLSSLQFHDGSNWSDIATPSIKNYLQAWANASRDIGTVSNGTVSATGTRTGSFSAWASTNTTNISISRSPDTGLRGSYNYLFSQGGTPASATGGTFVETPAFSLEPADLGKPVSITFDVTGVSADGNFDVCVVRYNSVGTYQETIPVAGNASTATVPSAKLPTGRVQFRGFFVTGSSPLDSYAVRFRRLAGTDVPRIDTLYVGPQQQLSSAAVTDWQSYTPDVFENTNNKNSDFSTRNGFWRRVGDSIEVRAYFIRNSNAASGSGQPGIGLPSGITIDLAKSSNGIYSGTFAQNTASPDVYRPLYTTGSSTIITIGDYGVGASYATVFASTSTDYGAMFTLPISNWSSNVTMAERAVEEYASNSSTSTSGSDTTSFSNTSLGETIKSFSQANADVVKRVRTSSVITATDNLKLEVSPGNDKWFEASSLFPYIAGDSARYGMTVQNVANSTDIDVLFGGDGAAPSTPWSGFTSWRWRIKKTSGGAAVGFPISGANILNSDNSIAMNQSTGAWSFGTSGVAATHRVQTGNTTVGAIAEVLSVTNMTVNGAAQNTNGGPAIVFRDVSSGGGIFNHPAVRLRAVGTASNNAHGFAIDVTPNAGSPLGVTAASATADGAWTLGTSATLNSNYNTSHKMNGNLSVFCANIGASTSPTFLHNSSQNLMIGWNRSDGSQEISFVKSATAGVGAFGFYVTTSTTTTTGIAYGFVDGSWNLGSGGTSSANVVFNYTGGAVRPIGDGQVNFGLAGNRWATLFAVSGTINTSDARLKQNIQDLDTSLSKVMQLKPRKWQPKYDSYQVGHSGFVAQELEEVFPHLVQTQQETIEGHENIKTVGVSGPEMIAILVKAMQEQQEMIESLKARIEVLEKN